MVCALILPARARGRARTGKILLPPLRRTAETSRPSVWKRGTLVWVRVVVTEIGWDGSMRRRALDTSGLTDAGRWENLIEQVLAFPPPYRAAPGGPVYVIHAGDRAVFVGEQGLTGPLLDLVTSILAAGGPAWRRSETGLNGDLTPRHTPEH
jgi:hypothetical protein